ncbi:hypothetical protein WG66_016966 [Moniliophthora roreri]|uniref:Putative MFS general substrate transporter n=1 Tax=Moniliophthora roreri TaxID=221103 RepID=A0A0W0EXP4_MONRR|nr:hypothetical protein WG66_016966 [Moniliophthora roreri]
MSHRESQAETGDVPSETTPLLPEVSENRQARTPVRIRGILIVAVLFYTRSFTHQQLSILVRFFCHGESTCPGNVDQLIAIIAPVGVFISILMTGFWTRMSDIRGRKVVLTFISAGMLLLDLVLAIVTFVSPFPKTFVIMHIVGTLVQSIFGGIMTVNALAHSYIADGRPYDKRAICFSFLDGIKMLAAYLANIPFVLTTGKSQVIPVLHIFAVVISTILLLGIICCLEESLLELPDSTVPLLADAKESLKGLLSPITIFIAGGGHRQQELFLVGLSVLAYSFIEGSHLYEIFVVAWSYEWSEFTIFMVIEPNVLLVSYLVIIPIILYLSRRVHCVRERTASEILISRGINYLHIICAILALAIPHVIGYILFGIVLPGLVAGIFPLLYTIGSIYYELDHSVTHTGTLYGALAAVQSLGGVLPALIFRTSLYSSNPSGYFSYIIRGVRLACLVIVAVLLCFPGAQNPIVEMAPDESSAPRADVDSDAAGRVRLQRSRAQ